MKTVLPFRDIENSSERLRITWQGQPLSIRSGNLAAGLLAAGVAVVRNTPASGAPRGPFCMMGACFDCLVEIDGVNRQACMIEATEGMNVRMARAAGNNAAS